MEEIMSKYIHKISSNLSFDTSSCFTWAKDEFYLDTLDDISIPILYDDIDNMIEELKDIKSQRENNDKQKP